MATKGLDADELQLVEDVSRYALDPYGFVIYAFPWGVKGKDLERHKGPRRWQAKFLQRMGERLRANAMTAEEVIQFATATGHGVGKSALVSMICCWALSTREDTRIVVTANTEGQLTSKTWPELIKWFRMCITARWFKLEATSIHAADPTNSKTWRIDMIPWSEHNTEAFAGLHNEGKRIVLIFDEASAIADKIWEVAEGALTDADTQIMWLVFGNPTKNVGRFFDCFHRLRHRWETLQLDSRTVEGTNKDQIDKWVKDEGEDSDFVRIRVRGVFPRASTMQFIDRERVDLAMARDLPPGTRRDLAIVGVDVARFGPCQSVIATRLGRDMRTYPFIKRRGLDAMTLAGLVSKHIKELRAAGLQVLVNVDEGGMGGPVVDRLRQLNYGDIVFGVNFGGDPDDKSMYKNKRAEMYGRFKEWLPAGSLQKDDELLNETQAIEYTFTDADQIILMRKEKMIIDGLVSPDTADACALTFAVLAHEAVRHHEDSNHAAANRRSHNPQATERRRAA